MDPNKSVGSRCFRSQSRSLRSQRSTSSDYLGTMEWGRFFISVGGNVYRFFGSPTLNPKPLNPNSASDP